MKKEPPVELPHHPNSRLLRALLNDPLPYITKKSQSIPGAKYYPEFRLLTLMGDGFPMVRFVFSENMETVFFCFCDDNLNYGLNHMSNPDGIPHIFLFKHFKKYLKRVRL